MEDGVELLLRVRLDKKSIVKKEPDMLLRVRQDKRSSVKNEADLLLRVS